MLLPSLSPQISVTFSTPTPVAVEKLASEKCAKNRVFQQPRLITSTDHRRFSEQEKMQFLPYGF
jgi:hypothetical protein